jgi:hypothetical protein
MHGNYWKIDSITLDLVQNHVRSLFNMSVLKPDSSLSVRKPVDTVNRNIRALTTLGDPNQIK